MTSAEALSAAEAAGTTAEALSAAEAAGTTAEALSAAEAAEAAAEGRLSARRAVEALRNGVPSREAVAALGSGQADIEDRFLHLLDTSAVARRREDRGLLFGGGFGAGKSHVLAHLAHLGSSRRFVVSHVVISKETPLHDPVKTLRAAVDSAISPGGAPGAVADAAAMLDPGSPAYAELMRWSSGTAVSERFSLTLSLLPYALENDGDFAEAIVRFWSGDPLAVGDLRRHARLAGQGRPALATVPARDLARQRLRFLTRLFLAAGYEGWVVLLDEVELIGRYTLLQRGRSYAELVQWLHPDAEDPGSPIVPVVAMTDDFDAAVLTAKNDREVVPSKLRAKQTSEWAAIAAGAEDGMRLIERAMVTLVPPDADELDRVYRVVKALHGRAFDWEPPDVAGLERLGATRMRQCVRAWINEWDLLRLDPRYQPRTEAIAVSFSYDEQTALED